MRRASVATAAVALGVALAALGAGCGGGEPVRLGSKKFTESVILAEAGRLLLADAGIDARHRRELGGTAILWHALLAGEIDAYPEYTGTIAAELLAGETLPAGDDEALRAALARHGVAMSPPLGFEDTYALGMPEALAARLGIRRISDLRGHPELVFAFSHEFLERAEGWPSLQTRYGLPQTAVSGVDHEVAYRGLAAGSVQLTDLYSTDAEIEAAGLRVLEDDLHHFPDYRAVWLYRADLARRSPAAVAQLVRLSGHISAAEMIRANARARVGGQPESSVAADLLDRTLAVRVAVQGDGRWARIAARSREHLGLVAASMAAAILVAVPLGVLAGRRRRIGALVVGATGLVQTVPSLALLVFMIPLLGIGWTPAAVALFLYALLPIVRSTAQGLLSIPPPLRESAEALGLTPWARLRLVELPLAAPAILAGIKTATVITIGTATLGALIGAGGYGQPIMTGIRLDDTGILLEGAIPAALLALAAQALFALAERWLIPRGLRGG